ncbi:transcriptional regulatory [Fusarium circinatum]|uniref:Transcriptional regulatory n=1 Tax=Fusarium circinatum TaxID=48490 RepID=A0A8H5T8R1_FUSCI|nr:transcriptional regulatory [Fusarium circinatum]
MPDPVSITASILGIVQGVAFLSSTIENIRSAPESIKNIQRQLQHLKPVLTQLAYAVDQKRLDTDQFGAEIKSAIDNCDQACTEFSTSLGHWTRHSSDDETSVLDYTKIGLLRQGRIRLMKNQLDQCIKILNVTLVTNNALQMSRQEGMIKELRDHKLLSLEASLKEKIDEVQTDKMKVVKYEAEASGPSETDDKESLTSEIQRHKKMVQISEKLCKKALAAVIIERTQQNISDVCAAEESTALAALRWQIVDYINPKHRSVKFEDQRSFDHSQQAPNSSVLFISHISKYFGGLDFTMTTSKPKILVVLTSADKVPKTGKQIGWYLVSTIHPRPLSSYPDIVFWRPQLSGANISQPELAHPFHVLNPLAELVYATPKGGESPLDSVSVELFKDDPVCKDFLENHESVWKNTLKLSEVAGRASEFDAVFYPGGHGPMVDLVDDEHSKSLLRGFHSQDKVIAAVCHGPAAFVNVTTASGELILKGKQVTGFDDVGEEMFQFTEDMDFSLEKRLGEASGGKYVKADQGPLAEKVVVDGKMITGQNPASSKGVAEEIAKALGNAKSVSFSSVVDLLQRLRIPGDGEIDRLRARVKELEGQLRDVSVATPPDEDTPETVPNDPSPSFLYANEGVQLDTTMTIQSLGPSTQFYGPSSTYYFIHCISQRLKTNSGALDTDQEPHSLIPNSASRCMINVINIPDAELDEPPISDNAIPDRATHGLTDTSLSGKDLSATQEACFLDLFWDSWHCCYQLLDEAEFKEHYNSLWDDPTGGTRKDSPLVDIVLALCMQFGVTPLPRESGYKAEINSRDAAIAGRWLYQRCQRLISCHLERPTLETFLCQLWSAIYLANASYQNMAQNMLGAAARTAYTLGLHIEPGNDLPAKQREARRRAWCILFIFETRSCIRLGRPWVSQTQPISSLLPTSDLGHVTAGLDQLRYTTERARLTEIARSAFDRPFELRSIDEAKTTTSDSLSNAYASGMDRMRAWAQSLPDLLKTQRRSGGMPLSTDLSEIEIEHFAPVSLQRQRLMLELFYHELMLTLGRHPISQYLTRAGIRQTSSSHEVADISVLHVAATTKLLHQVYQEYEILNGWYEPFNCQWNAAITLVGYLLAYPQDSPTNTIARTPLSQSITVLEKIGQFFGTASSAADVIRTLHQRLNMPADVHMTADSNTVTPDTVQDMDLNEIGSLDLSFEGILGTFGTDSEFERLGFGIDMQEFLANDDS